VKLTNNEIFSSKEAFDHLIDRDDIPVKYAMPLIRMAKKLTEEVGLIETRRNRLIKKYGVEKDGKVFVSPDVPDWDKALVEFTELMNLEIDVNIEKAKIPSNIIIPNKDLMMLEPFLEVVDA
jgi:hypothetical protein